jgi:transcription termination/antitermination protein NusA
VWSNDPNVDPVGACVGARGSRVRMVTNELRGERVDVVPFSDDPVELIQNALAPARVREVRLDEETGTATVIVSDFQLSLAIGKEGQNARLAARLTGWRIDIKSETQLAEEEAGYAGEDWAEGEWVEDEKGELVWKPAEGGEAMSASEWTHAAEDPAEEVVVVSEAADGSVTIEDVTVTETPDGDVIVDDLVVTESPDGEVTAEEVVVVADADTVAEAVAEAEAEAAEVSEAAAVSEEAEA